MVGFAKLGIELPFYKDTILIYDSEFEFRRKSFSVTPKCFQINILCI